MSKIKSQKLLASWSGDIQVGIYNSSWSLRLYADRALLVMPYVKWVGNTGGYSELKTRITGNNFEKILSIANREIEDDAIGKYIEEVREIIWEIDLV